MADRNGMLRIVVADGDANVRSALALLLERQAGMRVVGEVSSAERVLACAREHEPDLVLLDWDLPGLRAGVLTAELRALLPTVRVVALSTKAERRATALADGGDAFVCKAEAPDGLLVTLQALSAQLVPSPHH